MSAICHLRPLSPFQRDRTRQDPRRNKLRTKGLSACHLFLDKSNSRFSSSTVASIAETVLSCCVVVMERVAVLLLLGSLAVLAAADPAEYQSKGKYGYEYKGPHGRVRWRSAVVGQLRSVLALAGLSRYRMISKLNSLFPA